MFKRFAASLVFSLALVAFGAPSLHASTLHCTGCTYDGSVRNSDGSTTHYFTCDECHIHP
jgi:hypothetical protein